VDLDRKGKAGIRRENLPSVCPNRASPPVFISRQPHCLAMARVLTGWMCSIGSGMRVSRP